MLKFLMRCRSGILSVYILLEWLINEPGANNRVYLSGVLSLGSSSQGAFHSR